MPQSQPRQTLAAEKNGRVTGYSDIGETAVFQDPLGGPSPSTASEVLLEQFPCPPLALFGENDRLRLAPGIGDVALLV